MKKIYTLIAFGISALTYAQHTLNQGNHAPVAGDKYEMYDVDPSGISPGNSGAGQTWNFSASNVNTVSAKVHTVTPNTNNGYPAANQAISVGPDTLYRVSSTASDLRYHSIKLKTPTLDAVFSYSAPAVYAAYPMSLNTTSSTAVGGTLNATMPIQATGTFTGNCTTLADGSGTLTLSTGTFTDVIRIKVSQVISFSATISGFPTTGSLDLVVYEWYAKGIKAPLFSVFTGTASLPLQQPVAETMAMQNKDAIPTADTTSVAENHAGLPVSVYPQPGYSVLHVANLPVNSATMDVFDLAGRKIADYQVGGPSRDIDISQYPGGIFTYKITGPQGQVLHTGRFTVAR